MKTFRGLVRIGFFLSMLPGLVMLAAPLEIRLQDSFIPAFASWTYPLGTDRMGRNIYALYCYGAFVTILVSVPARILTLAFSSLIALVVYYAGKVAEFVFQSLSSVFISVPSLLVALVVIQMFHSGFAVLVLAIVLSDWALAYETLQNRIRDVRGSGFVISSLCFGANKFTVFRTHILGSLSPLIFLLFVTGIPSVIMTLSIFSFLGVEMGGDIFGPGLGEQIAFSKDYFNRSPAAVITPVAGILFMVYSFGREKE